MYSKNNSNSDQPSLANLIKQRNLERERELLEKDKFTSSDLNQNVEEEYDEDYEDYDASENR